MLPEFAEASLQRGENANVQSKSEPAAKLLNSNTF
jgi:hypothetical protein